MGNVIYSLIYIWIGIAIIVFIILLKKINAPYGKFYNEKWGKSVNSRIGWEIMESPSLLIPPLFLFYYKNSCNGYLLFITFLWVFHYFYRTILFPIKIPNTKNMANLILLFGFLFNVINALFNFYLIFTLNSYRKIFPLNISGTILFITGFYIHYTSDSILIKLRRQNIGGYKIPEGFLFKYISCPNYLGEIIQWFGWFLLTLNVSGFSFLFWTITNLFPRAINTHRWYKKTFPNYPEERKAIIPFVL